MYGQTNSIGRSRSGVGVGSQVAIDVYDEVPDAGDVMRVYVQLCDRAGNGVPLAGAVVGLAVGADIAGDEALGTLEDTSVTTDADGWAGTWLTIDAGAPPGTRLYVYNTTLTVP